MKKSMNLKRTQVQGKKYELPHEEIHLEKLVKKGLSLDAKISELKAQLDMVKQQIIEIARDRRRDATSVNLKAISGQSTVTFRERYTCSERIEEIKHELGSLFDRFFVKKTEFKVQKDLKRFLSGQHTCGLEDPEPVKRLLSNYIKKTETKPNVKLVPDEALLRKTP